MLSSMSFYEFLSGKTVMNVKREKLSKVFDNAGKINYNVLRSVCKGYVMKLDLGKIINVPGESISFDFAMDLRDMEHNFSKPAGEPVLVSGRVVNSAGVLNLHMLIQTELSCVCDRCTKQFPLSKEVVSDSVIAEESNDSDDIILMTDGAVDLYEIAETAFILSLDSKTLCSEDCKGLCHRCGADLNLGPCDCEEDGDPRLAVFRELLKEKQEKQEKQE